jgi:hypothetical protein
MEAIPFKIPAEFLGEFSAGQIKRIGTNLVRADSGRIVGHLQEAGRLSVNLSGGLNPIVQSGQLASSLAANAQLHQVKKMLSGLQMMTSATLAVSAINLGVSVLGFAMVTRRLDQLGRQIGRLEGMLSSNHQLLVETNLRQRARDRAQVISQMALAEEAWTHSNPDPIWRGLADGLYREDSYYRILLTTELDADESVIRRGSVPWNDVLAAHETLTQLVAARTQCLVVLNELDAAIHYANEWKQWLARNYDSLTPPALVESRLRSGAQSIDKPQEYRRLEMLNESTSFLQVIRAQQEFARTAPDMITTLKNLGIPGRTYVEHLRSPQEQEILVLEAKSD